MNSEIFLYFNDSTLENAFKEYYYETSDIEYKRLYEMYRDRRRPKVIYEAKDLFDISPRPEFSVLKWTLTKEPNKISGIVGNDKWGYQIIRITLEKIHSHYGVSEKCADPEDLREAVKLYDYDTGAITYLAEDAFSIISNYCSEFIRIYVLEEKDKEYDYENMHTSIIDLLAS